MNAFYSFMNVAAVIYHTGGCLLRYWYVKASLRPEVAEVFMRRKTLLALNLNSLVNNPVIYIDLSVLSSLLMKVE